MTERSHLTFARAVREGFARAASAPALLIGTYAVSRLLHVRSASVSLSLSLLSEGARAVIVWLLFWSFAYGGAIDRLGRGRPTRAYGFFAACGGHLMPLARLAVLAIAAEAVLLPIASATTDLVRAALGLALMLASLVLAFARIRLVVEDRRSAVGAVAASIRFLRRNPSGLGIWIVFALADYGLNMLNVVLVDSIATLPDLGVRASHEAFVAIHLWLMLSAYGAGIALFQSRLAHAGYTAAPPAVWPESASVEAIANAAPYTAR